MIPPSASWRSGPDDSVPGSGLPGFGGGGRCRGAYQLTTELGRGAHGVVYRARESRSGREVALKVLFRGDARTLLRFEREVEAIRRLDHPHLVRLLDHGLLEGRPFLVTELVAGGSLAEAIRVAGALEPQRAASLIRDAAAALEFAHAQGVLHRDLKPDNLLIDSSGVRLVDFGLARVAALSEKAALTKSGAMIGTGPYLSPEQVRGERALVGPRSEVYSLGATLYEALTGEPPFAAASLPELFVRVCEEPPIPPSARRPGVPKLLDEICLRCLAKDPLKRFESAAELSTALTDYLELGALEPSRTGSGSRLALSLSLAGGLVVVALALGLTSEDPTPETAATHTTYPEASPENATRFSSDPLSFGPTPGPVASPSSALPPHPLLAPGLARWSAQVSASGLSRTGPWLLLEGGEKLQLTRGEGLVAGPVGVGPAAAWDPNTERLLLATAKGVAAWQADLASTSPLVGALLGRPLSLSVAGTRLLVGSRSGELQAFDLEDPLKARWSLSLEGAIAAPPLPLDLTGLASHALVGTLASQLFLVDSKRGRVDATLSLPSPIRYQPLLLPERGGGLVVCVVSQGGELGRYRVSAGALKQEGALELEHVVASQPLLLSTGPRARLFVATCQGWLFCVSSTLDEVHWATQRHGNPSGGLALVDLDRDGSLELCSAWLQTQPTVKAEVLVHSLRGEELFSFTAGARPFFVGPAGENTLLGTGEKTYAWGPWKTLSPRPRGARELAWSNLCGGAYRAAIRHASSTERPERGLLEALAEWHLGAPERIAALRRGNEAGLQRSLRPVIERWASRGDLSAARRLASPIGLGFPTPPLPPMRHLKTLVAAPNTNPTSFFVDFLQDPLRIRGPLKVWAQGGSFRRKSRLPIGILLGKRGALRVGFALEERTSLRLHLLHRALPNHVLGYAAYQLQLDGRRLGAPRASPAVDRAETRLEEVSLGELSVGSHMLTLSVLPDSATLYDLQRLELLPETE